MATFIPTTTTAMISLDLPDGTLPVLEGGVTDHHVTVVYLGSDVDEAAYERACQRAAAAASVTPALSGAFRETRVFGPSDHGTPLIMEADIPGVHRLRGMLADLNGSPITSYRPHVTLTYLQPGDLVPAPPEPAAALFTHLSVHRGGEVRHFRLAGENS